MMDGTDDDDLFSPGAGAKLATLFENLEKTKNESLTYTPPRQPKSVTVDDPPKSKPQSSVLCAKPVVLFKSVNGKYDCKGKYGLALIGNDDLKTYELMAYKDKHNILTKAKIQPTFSYNLFPDNFASFFDDTLQNWSVLFENTKSYREFVSELEKRNVKIVDNCKKTSDAEVKTTPAEDDEKAMGGVVETKAETTPAEDDKKTSGVADSSSGVSGVSKQSRLIQQTETDASLVTIRKQQPQTKVPVVSMTNQQPQAKAALISMINQQQHFPPGTDPFSCLWMENQAQNYEVRRSLSEIAIKMDTVLQMMERSERTEHSMLQTKVDKLQLSVSNLKTDLQEVHMENDRLHRLLQSKTYASVSGQDLLIGLQIEKIECLEKQLEAKQDNEPIRQCKTFADQLLLCSDLVGLNDVCKKYKSDNVVVASICKVLCAILKQNDEKADNFVGKLSATMDNFQQYIVKHYDTENKTLPPDFISKLLPKTTKAAANYLIEEFEKDFRIGDKDSLKPDLDLSESDD